MLFEQLLFLKLFASLGIASVIGFFMAWLTTLLTYHNILPDKDGTFHVLGCVSGFLMCLSCLWIW